MDAEETIDHGRRDFLVKATGTACALGVAAMAVPFVSSMLPSADVEAAAAPVRVDISKLQPGEQLTVEWQGKPVWIIKRTEEAIAKLKEVTDLLRDPDSRVEQQPEYARNATRSRRADISVLLGVCTHLGCAPTYRPDVGSLDASWKGGFYCSCHGSKFDLAGRVYKGVPAPINLEVPRYAFINENELIIGVDAPETVEVS